MRISKSKRQLWKQYIFSTYTHEGKTTVREIAASLGLSDTTVRKYMREMGLIPNDAAARPRRTGDYGRNAHLTEEQMALLFEGLEEHQGVNRLFYLRHRAKELFGLELLDTTLYRWMRAPVPAHAQRAAGSPGRPRGPAPRTQERLDRLVAECRALGPQFQVLSIESFQARLQRIWGRKMSRAAAYQYFEKVRLILKEEQD